MIIQINIFAKTKKYLFLKLVSILAAMVTCKLKEAGWTDVINSAVIQFGQHDTKVYDYAEFAAGAQKALEQGEVGGKCVTLGPLLKNNTHYMGVDNIECREELIRRGSLEITGRRFRVRSVDDTRFTARPLGAPIRTSQCHCEFS